MIIPETTVKGLYNGSDRTGYSNLFLAFKRGVTCLCDMFQSGYTLFGRKLKLRPRMKNDV